MMDGRRETLRVLHGRVREAAQHGRVSIGRTAEHASGLQANKVWSSRGERDAELA